MSSTHKFPPNARVGLECIILARDRPSIVLAVLMRLW